MKLKRRSIGGINCIGFANAGHIDTCDLIAKHRMKAMINNNNDLSGPELGQVKDYFQHINDTTGMGLTTTCGYNHCGNGYGMKTVAKFAVGGFTMDLLHHRVHHFHAFAYPHFTIAPILVGNLHVRLSNTEYKEPFFVFAWGSCGGKKEEEANRQPIERQDGFFDPPAIHDRQLNHFPPHPPPPQGQPPPPPPALRHPSGAVLDLLNFGRNNEANPAPQIEFRNV